MATLVRKSFGNLRNLSQCRSLCVGYYTKEHNTTWHRRYREGVCREFHILRWRQFHTTQANNKIVAFKLSDIGEGIREVVIKEWFVKVGDKVQQFDNICEVQSDKAAVTITSRYDGVIKKLYHEVDKTALVGQALVDIELEDDAATPSETTSSSDSDNEVASKPEATSSTETNNQRVKVLTTPAVRRIAAQFKVDLSTVKATGRNGRVLKEDVLGFLNISSDKSNEVPVDMSTTARTQEVPFTPAKAKIEPVLEDKTVPVTGFTKAMVKSMTEAMKIPHFVFSDEYDVTKLVEARKALKLIVAERGMKLTYMPIIIKAASLGLTKYPILNSSLDSSCENITYKASHNIGVAMDTPNGLIVPVIRNVQQKNIMDIARDLARLQESGSKGQLGLSDLTGGTFTLSNIGIVGGTYTKPVIFPPQVSIGALGKIQVLPRFDSLGNVVKAHILSVSWSADHRVIDGVTMARFSETLKG